MTTLKMVLLLYTYLLCPRVIIPLVSRLICGSLYPELDISLIDRLVKFNQRLQVRLLLFTIEAIGQ